MAGTLYICGLPIGDPGTIHPGVVDVLRSVEYIACEDTRTFALHYSSLKLNKPFVAYHDHASDARQQKIVADLAAGRNIALVSDAGMPLISDPGYHLVQEAVAVGALVRTLPGPTALITALVLSGLPTDRFTFEGFLKPKENARCKQLELLVSESRTMIFYESPHRIERMLEDVLAVLGDRTMFMGRELTKKYEEHYRGTVAQVLAVVKQRPPKGELVVVIAGAALA